MIIKGYIYSLLYGVACLLLALVAYKLGLDKKYTRKIVHILVGFEWLILYLFMGASIHFVAVCLIFTALVMFAYFSKSMPMISSDSENAAGTVYYCISMTLMAIVSLFIKDAILSFGVAVFCTSFGDGFAGVAGQSIKSHNPKLYQNKTLFGMLVNFAFSFITALVFVSVFDFNADFRYMILVASISAEIELFVGKGLDNIALPLGIFTASLIALEYPGIYFYLLPILITPLIVYVVLAKKWLTRGGVACALALDLFTSLAFGNFGFVFILLFLVGGTLMDKLKKRDREMLAVESSKSARSFSQVFANAFAPIVCAILFLFTHVEIFELAFYVSVIEAFADTSASAFGVFSKNTYDIYRLKKCKKGISGGVSLVGTLSALAVCLLMAMLVFICRPVSISKCALISLAAFIGIFIDTLFGSIVQVKYRCSACGELTERNECCGSSCEKHSGITVIKNETVNFISSILSVLLYIVIHIILF